MSSSASTGTPCVNDSQESNDTESEATALGTIDECDSQTLTAAGVLAGDDTDWFSYDGDDTFAVCTIDPGRTINADGQVRVCKFIDCDTPDFVCPAGASDATSPDGLPGCCAQGSLTFSMGCDGTILDDSATVYIRVDKPSGFDCVTYSMVVHF